jgi:PhoPQ-activated pathogenicity-related protein
MKGMKGIQRSSHPQLTSMVKMLRKQLIKAHEDKKKLSVVIEKYRDAQTTTHFADDPIDFTDWIAIQDSDIV